MKTRICFIALLSTCVCIITTSFANGRKPVGSVAVRAIITLSEKEDAYEDVSSERFSFMGDVFQGSEIQDFSVFITRLKSGADPISVFLWEKFSENDKSVLTKFLVAAQTNAQNEVPDQVPALNTLHYVLNKVIRGQCIYDAARFKDISLRPLTTNLLVQNPQGKMLVKLNRLLLEDAYRVELSENRLQIFNIRLTEGTNESVRLETQVGAVTQFIKLSRIDKIVFVDSSASNTNYLVYDIFVNGSQKPKRCELKIMANGSPVRLNGMTLEKDLVSVPLVNCKTIIFTPQSKFNKNPNWPVEVYAY